jgi:GNAT superfamily N-acetyltransferase
MLLAAARARGAIRSDDVLNVFYRNAAAGPSPKTRPNLIFREATSSDGPLFARDIGTESAETFRLRLSEETRCFLVLHGERVIHATWVTTNGAWTRELGRWLCPPPGDAYLYESFTRPEVRGQGVYPLVLIRISEWLADRRVERAWVAVEASNRPSMRAVTKAGFLQGFEVPYRRRWGRVTVGAPTGPLAAVGRRFVKEGCAARPIG